MTRHLTIFLIMFALGAGVAVVVRISLHRPYEVIPAATPAAQSLTTVPQMSVAAAPAASTSNPQSKPVNTQCPICGMPVKIELGTALYQGQVVGFGCKACPPKFAADPEAYGPAALKNQVVE